VVTISLLLRSPYNLTTRVPGWSRPEGGKGPSARPAAAVQGEAAQRGRAQPGTLDGRRRGRKAWEGRMAFVQIGWTGAGKPPRDG